MAKYQYETSPRKVKTNYEIPNQKKQNKVDVNKQLKQNKTKKTLKKSKIIFYIIIGFAMFFTISYRNAMIDIKYAKIKKLKSELATVQKENEQLEASVEQALNLKAVQEEAKNNLGMKTLSTDQIEYINLSKKDHIESRTETQEEKNYFEKIVGFIKKLVK